MWSVLRITRCVSKFVPDEFLARRKKSESAGVYVLSMTAVSEFLQQRLKFKREEYMKKFAVFGNPIAHSKSPQIHEAFAKQFGIELNYERILVEDDLFTALTAFYKNGGYGANITAPFKEQAFVLMHEITPRVQQAGAINTITFVDADHWRGDNTDGIGLLRDLTQNCQIPIANQNILILGAGGATRSILASLLSANPKQITIANRTLEKAKQLVQIFKSYDNLMACSFAELTAHDFTLIIHATSAGVKGEPIDLPEKMIKNAICYDLTYGQAAQGFLKWAQNKGARMCYDGLGMLVEQAAEGFYVWHQVMPETRSVIREIRNM